jgi:hypothetical protein
MGSFVIIKLHVFCDSLLQLPSIFVPVVSVPTDQLAAAQRATIFCHYITDNQCFIIRVFAFANCRVGHSPRMQNVLRQRPIRCP